MLICKLQIKIQDKNSCVENINLNLNKFYAC